MEDIDSSDGQEMVRRKDRSKKKTRTEDLQVFDIEEEIDIDLEDPDVDAAALKIQASFKGKKARDEVSQMRKAKSDAKAQTPINTGPIRTKVEDHQV